MACFGTRKKKNPQKNRQVSKKELEAYVPESFDDLLTIMEGRNQSVEELEREREEIMKISHLTRENS